LTLVSVLFGLCIGAIAPDVEIGGAIVPLFSITFVLFAG